MASKAMIICALCVLIPLASPLEGGLLRAAIVKQTSRDPSLEQSCRAGSDLGHQGGCKLFRGRLVSNVAKALGWSIASSVTVAKAIDEGTVATKKTGGGGEQPSKVRGVKWKAVVRQAWELVRRDYLDQESLEKGLKGTGKDYTPLLVDCLLARASLA